MREEGSIPVHPLMSSMRPLSHKPEKLSSVVSRIGETKQSMSLLGSRGKFDYYVERVDVRVASWWCKNFHYSGTLPMNAIVFECIEFGKRVGIIAFGTGSLSRNGYAVAPNVDVAWELVRVAMKDHTTQVSAFVKLALRSLRKIKPEIDAIMSYADSGQNHRGGIYKAGGWIYLGESNATSMMIHGVKVHVRSVVGRYGYAAIAKIRSNVDPNASLVPGATKYRFAMPMCASARRRIKKCEFYKKLYGKAIS